MGCSKTHWIRIGLASLFAILVAVTALAGVPKKINYQGRLIDGVTGLPLAGPHSLVVRIFDGPSGGNLLWSETAPVEADSAGVFTLVLGSVDPIDVTLDGPLWLEVQADGEILLPRREVVSVPYAFTTDEAGHASAADSLGGYGADAFVLKGENGSITATMIVGGSGSGLDADLLDGQNASAFAEAVHHHDDRYYTKPELNTGDGTINQAGDPVDWTKLKSVPAGFADGIDNVGGDGYSLDAADGNPTDVVYVDNDGKVLIGSATPIVAKLHVAAGPSQDAIFAVTNTATGAYGYSNSGTGVIGASDTGNGVVGISNSGKAGSFTGEVFASGRVDSDSGFSIDGVTVFSASREDNLAIGRHSSNVGSMSHHNTCVGDSTGFLVLWDSNTLIGYNAGHGSPPHPGGELALMDGYNSENVAVGSYAGYRNFGMWDVFVGSQAGVANTEGRDNTYVGSGAGRGNITGDQNVCIGKESGQSSTDGTGNVMIGPWAGASRLTGGYNVWLGHYAGAADYGGLGTTGDYNTAVGAYAGLNAAGSRNVFLGYEAGHGINGDDHLVIANGKDAADVLIFGNFATGNVGIGTLDPERKLHILGNGPRVLIESTGGNPEINMENTDDTAAERWAIYKNSTEDDLRFYQNGDRVTFESGTGNVAIGATDPAGYRLYVNGTAYATGGWQPSDLRLKTDLVGIDDALGKVLRLEGVSFRWRTEDHPDRGFPGGRHYGLVAQEVEKVLPEVVGSGPGDEKALAYSELIPVLVEAVKELKAESDELRAENRDLRQRLEALERADNR